MTVVINDTCGFCGVDLKCELTSSDRIDGEEEMRYTTYGIRVTGNDGNPVFEREDISTDKAFVKEFIALCKTRFVAGVHIRDVLDDYLP